MKPVSRAVAAPQARTSKAGGFDLGAIVRGVKGGFKRGASVVRQGAAAAYKVVVKAIATMGGHGPSRAMTPKPAARATLRKVSARQKPLAASVPRRNPPRAQQGPVAVSAKRQPVKAGKGPEVNTSGGANRVASSVRKKAVTLAATQRHDGATRTRATNPTEHSGAPQNWAQKFGRSALRSVEQAVKQQFEQPLKQLQRTVTDVQQVVKAGADAIVDKAIPVLQAAEKTPFVQVVNRAAGLAVRAAVGVPPAGSVRQPGGAHAAKKFAVNLKAYELDVRGRHELNKVKAKLTLQSSESPTALDKNVNKAVLNAAKLQIRKKNERTLASSV